MPDPREGIGAYLNVAPSSLAFGDVTIGTTVDIDVGIINDGDVDVTIFSIVMPSGYTQDLATPHILAPGANVSILVTFAPVLVQAYNGTMRINSNAINNPVLIAITGNGIAVGAKAISVNPSEWDFGQIKVTQASAEKTFTITNTGTVNVTVTGITFTPAFTAGTLPAFPAVITPGSTLNFGATFNPTVEGYTEQAAAASIAGDQTGAPTAVKMSGTGVLIFVAYTVNSFSRELMAAFALDDAVTIKRFNSASLDCEEPASFKRRYNYGMPGFEKTLQRVIAQYEALGVATVTVTFRTKRGSVSTALNTSALTDQSLQRIYADLQLTDEVIEVEVSRAASSGPLQFTELLHEFQKRGEIIKGT